MSKPIRYIMYAVILIICATSIVVAVYSMENKVGKQENTVIGEEGDENEEKSTLEKFKGFFNNTITNIEAIENLVPKIDPSKPAVFEAGFSENQNGKYSIDVHLPSININTDVGNQFNNATNQNFSSRVGSLISEQKATEFTVYETSYTGFVNDGILSVAIMGSIKQGDNAQRIILATYNYNVATGQEVKIGDIIQNRGLDTTAVNKKINNEIRKIQEESESLAQTGYEVYKRKIEDEMYNISNTTTFIQGPDGELYLIYAYGNTNNTSEIDVVEI